MSDALAAAVRWLERTRDALHAGTLSFDGLAEERAQLYDALAREAPTMEKSAENVALAGRVRALETELSAALKRAAEEASVSLVSHRERSRMARAYQG